MDPTTKTIIIGVLMLLVGTALTAIVALFARVRGLEQAQAKMATQVEPLWSVVQAKMVKDLTHPDREFHETDDLLAKLDQGTITVEERATLLKLMEERVINPNPKVGLPERETAGAMAFVMKKVQEDEASNAPIAEVQVVTVKAMPDSDEDQS